MLAIGDVVKSVKQQLAYTASTAKCLVTGERGRKRKPRDDI